MAGSTRWISVDGPNGSAISEPTADGVCLRPKDVRGTSVIPSRSPNATPINPGTARYANLNAGTTAMSKATSKI